ncbi:hypothetical protein DFH06DRAFT_1151809 [Mycena polygramma]|nr:hypothetical protein DFH06DRAFT_1151809 [Mycena polygramma]
MASIDDLTFDLLSLILWLAGRSTRDLSSCLSWKLFDRNRKAICCVCRKWRDVAYETVKLWTMMPITSSFHEDYIAMTVKNSKKAPLIVFLDLTHHPSLTDQAVQDHLDKMALTLRTHFVPTLERVESLTVLCHASTHWAYVRDILALGTTGHAQRFSLRITPVSWSAPTREIDMADLRNCSELRLVGAIPIIRPNATFAGMTALRLLRCSMSWLALSSTLLSMPGLRFLELDSVSATSLPRSDSQRRTIALRHLRHLELALYGPASMEYLAMLEVPVLATLHVSFHTSSVEPFRTVFAATLASASHVNLWLPSRMARPEMESLLSTLRDTVSLDIGVIKRSSGPCVMELLQEGTVRLPSLVELSVRDRLDTAEAKSLLGTMEDPFFARGCRVLSSRGWERGLATSLTEDVAVCIREPHWWTRSTSVAHEWVGRDIVQL